MRKKPHDTVILAALILLYVGSRARADTIVSVNDRLLSHDILTPGCEWVDTFERTTTTTETNTGAGNVYSIRSGDGEMYVDYVGYANPCFVPYAPHPAFWDTPEYQAWCVRPMPESVTESVGGGGGSFVRTTISHFTKLTDNCPPEGCDHHPTPVPEPETWWLWLTGIGLIALSRILRRLYGRMDRRIDDVDATL